AAINYEDSICHASDSASPPFTTFSSPGLTGRRQRSAFLVRNPARCLRRYWNRWSWHPRRSVHLEKHSVADPVIEARVCNNKWAPSLDHCICCFLQNRLLTTSFTVDSTKPVAIALPL